MPSLRRPPTSKLILQSIDHFKNQIRNYSGLVQWKPLNHVRNTSSYQHSSSLSSPGRSFKESCHYGKHKLCPWKSNSPRSAMSVSISSLNKNLANICKDDYGALEPSISGKIMELHHKNHHQTYVNSFNAAFEKQQEAESKQDFAAQVALQPLINFHAGGHINHTLFWENLAPSKNGGGGEPSGQLKVRFARFPKTRKNVWRLIQLRNRLPSHQATATSPRSRPNSTQLSPASKEVVGHGSLKIMKLVMFKSELMLIKTRLLESILLYLVLMLGSMHTICNTRTERLSISMLSGMLLTGRLLRVD